MPGGPAGKLKRAAAAFYRRAPAAVEGNAFAQALAAEAANEVVQVWPENWQAWELFMQLRTQWTLGMGGPTGLRYEAAYPLLDRIAKEPAQWDSLFDDVQTMERAALAAIHDK